jgi:uncharacterized protein (DUF302 family)
MSTFGIGTSLPLTYDQALEQVPAALKSEGFGVLTEIDMQSTLKKKLSVDFRRYKIIGACNPPLAYEALRTDLEVGLMLPCNVVVYEGDDGRAVVLAVDPTKTMAQSGDKRLVELAGKVKDKLSRALARLAD